MNKNYRLNLIQQANGDHEVHLDGCRYYPTLKYINLGNFNSCDLAVNDAKRKEPYKKINGCIHCSKQCHTS